MTVTPELIYGKPQIPVVKKAGTAERKLHYGLNDGFHLSFNILSVYTAHVNSSKSVSGSGRAATGGRLRLNV